MKLPTTVPLIACRMRRGSTTMTSSTVRRGASAPPSGCVGMVLPRTQPAFDGPHCPRTAHTLRVARGERDSGGHAPPRDAERLAAARHRLGVVEPRAAHDGLVVEHPVDEVDARVEVEVAPQLAAALRLGE